MLDGSLGEDWFLVATGVVDEHVQPAMIGFGATDHSLDVRRFGDVRFVDVDRNDRSALLRQPLDEYASDPPRRR